MLKVKTEITRTTVVQPSSIKREEQIHDAGIEMTTVPSSYLQVAAVCLRINQRKTEDLGLRMHKVLL